MASTLSGPTERRLLSANVMPTVPSAPVTTLSEGCTGMPTRSGNFSVPRSRCAAPFATLTSPTSAAMAVAEKPSTTAAIVQRMRPPKGVVFTDSIMRADGPPTREKCPFSNVSCTTCRAAAHPLVRRGVLHADDLPAPGRPAPERGPRGTVRQHRDAWSPRREGRDGMDHARLARAGSARHLRGHRAAVQSPCVHRGDGGTEGQDRRPGRAADARAGHGTRVFVPLRPQPHPALARRLAFSRMDVPALRALAAARVERLEERRKIAHDVLHVDFHPMYERPAFRAIPLEGVVDVARTDLLHHQSHRPGLRPLRRMAVMARQQDDLARLHRNLPRAAILDHVEDDVAAQLVEEFLVRVVVVVAALVRTADHLDDQVLGRRKHEPVADRRFQQVRMLVDPAGKIERAEFSTGGHGAILAALQRD